MEREVRYCTTEDGARIAYCVEGEGPPFVMAPFSVNSFTLAHMVPAYEGVVRDLERSHQLIQFDARGSGASQRDVAGVSILAVIEDPSAVVEAVGLQRFALWGCSRGAANTIRYAARHPERVDKLVLYAPFVRTLDAQTRETLQAFAQMARANWEMTARAFADTDLRRRSEEIGLRYAEWTLKSVSGETMAAFSESCIEMDATSSLQDVQCPTLVLHRRDDVNYPLGQRIAAAIPGARFVPLPEGSLFVGDQKMVVDAIEAFLGGVRQKTRAEPQSAGLRTILSTDLVGHTEMMWRLGDEKGREVLREHERITRDVLKSHSGT